MGVMPRALWEKTIEIDRLHRQRIRINLLLIKHNERLILIDSGIGNKLPDKLKKIYNYSDFILPESLESEGYIPEDITDVILTHLHFDHAGGLISIDNEEKRLTFPNAVHWIQKDEWNIAKNPDALNKAAYNYERDLSLLEDEGTINLVNGDLELYKGIEVKKVGGHTEGFQIIEIETATHRAIYAGDIIPTQHHIDLPVISAYDISRKDSYKAKEYILNSNSTVYFSHDPEIWFI